MRHAMTNSGNRSTSTFFWSAAAAALVARIIYTFGAPHEPRQRLDLGGR